MVAKLNTASLPTINMHVSVAKNVFNIHLCHTAKLSGYLSNVFVGC